MCVPRLPCLPPLHSWHYGFIYSSSILGQWSLWRWKSSFLTSGRVLKELSSYLHTTYTGFPGGSDSRASTCNAGDLGLIPWLGRSPGEGNGNPLQHSCLENSMDGGVWWAKVHGVPKSWTDLVISLLFLRTVRGPGWSVGGGKGPCG